MLSNSSGSAPPFCGGSTTVTFTVTSDCQAPVTCNATFTVTNAPAVAITCPANVTEMACQTQATIDSKFALWKATASFTGGCGGLLTNSTGTAPNACGGSTSITFTVNSDCQAPVNCTASFTVTDAPAVTIICPANTTEAACQTQATIDAKFALWKATASFSGGCNGVLSNSSGSAPSFCGGSTPITFTVTSTCIPLTTTCVSTFTVTDATPASITCPTPITEGPCQTQAAIDASFAAWKNTATFTGGCNGVLSNNSTTAPNACGGTATITFTVTSTCAPITTTCNTTFTVTNAPTPVITCPTPVTEVACQTQAVIDSKFALWKTTATFTGGCNGVLSDNGATPPNACGGTATVTFTVTSTCAPFTTTCNASFTVTAAPAVVITCPTPATELACQSQAVIDAKFAAWKNTATFTGGCGGLLTNNGATPPNACGGTATVTFTVTSTCAPLTTTCIAAFTVTNAPTVLLTCPSPKTEGPCQTQAVIDASFAAWKNTATFTGGCGGILTNSGGTAPPFCGGTTTLTFTVNSDCQTPVTCNATFTVTNAPAVVINCPAPKIETACQTQIAIDASFAAWKTTASFTGGCGGILTNSSGTAPPFCGGVSNITFTVNSDCQAPVTCVGTFIVLSAPTVVITCPNPVTEGPCQSQTVIDTKFAAWKTTASFTGGCGGMLTNGSGTAPPFCGGSSTITFTVNSDCQTPVTCNATFTVTNAPAVAITCPAPVTEAACQNQTTIDSKFAAWKTTATFTGGCGGVLSNSSGSAPPFCGGSTTITFTVTSDCQAPVNCNATFTVTDAPAVAITCPANVTEMACQTQASIDAKFALWKTTASFTGGCGGLLTNGSGTAPDACGGTTSITFTVNSDCQAPVNCTATFTVTNAPAVTISCPANVTEAACQLQSVIDAKFAIWKTTASFTGGCNGVISNSSGTAPSSCGGSTPITFTVTSTCAPLTTTCVSTFTVSNATAISIVCPSPKTEGPCQTQAVIDASFAAWKTTASFTGGCNGILTNNSTTAPNACGGAATITFTVTSDCDVPKTCNATFTVTNSTPAVITCPTPATELACQTQAVIDSKFALWKTTATFTGGCNGVLSDNGATPPNACGGTATVTFTVTSTCAPFTTTCNASFTVTAAPAVVITCPTPATELACQSQAVIDSKFAAWKNTATFTGGCGGLLSNNGATPPNACGGTATVTFTVTSTCAPLTTTCVAAFTVTNAPTVVLTCPSPKTEGPCQSQVIIDASFAAWKNTATFIGGCNGILVNGAGSAPSYCGGTTTLTFTVNSDCQTPVTCNATFTVTNAPAVVINCPAPKIEAACQTQAVIDASFATWKNTASFSGGCAGMLTNNSGTAPSFCGGVSNITFTVNSDCQTPVTCVGIFIVLSAPSIVITCPTAATEVACQNQTTIDTKFAAWKNTATFTGGCTGILSNSGGTAPPFCGGSATITYTVTSDCQTPVTCNSTFTVTNAPAVVMTCPTAVFEAACQNQTTIDSKFAAWKNTASFTGGCGGILTSGSGTAPNACGGSTSITFTVNSDCQPPANCTATFTVNNAPAVNLTCPANVTEAACQLQTTIDSKFAAWKNTATFTGGCGGLLTSGSGTAPSACGGNTPITFTVTSDCQTPVSCSSTFTVNNATSISIICPSTVTEPACQTQAAIDAKFATWKNTATFSGGCNGVLTNNSGTSPSACGDSKSITFTVTSNCDVPKMCTATFNVDIAAPLVLTCPTTVTEGPCQTQASIDAKFNIWKNTVTFTGGCNGVITNNSSTSPLACGDMKTITFTVTSTCAPLTATCSSSFNVTTAPAAVITCPTAVTESACQLQSDIDTKFNNWKNTATFTGGCNGVISNNSSTSPLACGDVKTITFTVTSTCAPLTTTCMSTFTVTPAPLVVLNCPAPVTEPSCQTQSIIDSKFAAWKNTATFSGGCTGMLSDNGTTSPNACGEVKTVTFTVTSTCEPVKTCTVNFTVTNAPAVVITCPTPKTEVACQTQTAIDASFSAWKNTATFTGGCIGTLTNGGGTAPSFCGGSTTITYTVTSNCDVPKTCNATFTVTASPLVVLTCPTNVIETSCQNQATIDSKFATWKNTATFSGGCNGLMTNSTGTAPNFCGGVTSITYTVTSNCDVTKTCTASFTVNAAPAVVITCPANVSEIACQTQVAIDAKFVTWKNTATFTGGCLGVMTSSSGTAPSFCGGATTITFMVNSSCESPKICMATFTVVSSPTVILTCPITATENSCQTQTTIDSKFATWKNTATFAGGCGGIITNSGGVAPPFCGGSTTITFTVTSNCDVPKTCTSSFNVNAPVAVAITCPVTSTEAACQTQAVIDAKFATWKNTATFTGGCNGVLTNNGTSAPNACGGTTTVTFTVTSSCEPVKICTSSFTVNTASLVNQTCPNVQNEVSCQSQALIDSKFATWKNTATFSGGCNGVLTNNATTAPSACGGVATITFTVTSSCEPVKTCTSSFTVVNSPTLVLNCPANKTEVSCQNQAAIDQSFTAWKNTFSFTGGCNGVKSDNGNAAPAACGGSVIVTFTVTSTCDAPKTCNATFTVTTAPVLALTCPTAKTEVVCQTQAAINTSFANWKNTFTYMGGCNTLSSDNGPSAPSACGGTINVTFSVTSSCEPVRTCTSTFTVTTAPVVVLNCPANVTELACQTQAMIDSKFATWKASGTSSGGCNSNFTSSSGTAPLACGGTTTITYMVTSDCEPVKSCNVTFTVTAAPNVTITCPTAVTEAICQTQTAIDSKFATWKNTATFTGGCNGTLTSSAGTAPTFCGGSTTITFTVNSSCQGPITCNSTFTVNSPLSVALTCPSNQTEIACQTQANIDSKFAIWKNTATFSGGCNGVITSSSGTAPGFCGGATTITFTVTSSCETTKTCTSTFTVTNAPAVVLTCPANQIEIACQTEATILSKYNTWLNSVSATGGCNTNVSNNSTGAPSGCGGSKTVVYTVTSSCENSKSCSATFTVTDATPVVLTCPNNVTEIACQTQTLINTKYAAWLSTVTFNGGCNSVGTNNSSGPPSACGAFNSITFTVTSDCDVPKTCNASFTVNNAPSLIVTCPINVTENDCQTQDTINLKYTNWLNTVQTVGGCNVLVTNNNSGNAPSSCGESKTIVFTITSSCDAPKTCTSIFTVKTPLPLNLTCPIDKTINGCLTQTEVNDQFNTWLLTASVTGGCNPVITNNNSGAPLACGGIKSVIFQASSLCVTNTNCTAIFTVTSLPIPSIICPPAKTINCNASISPNSNGFATGLDACNSPATITFTDLTLPGACINNFKINRTWLATDKCGNTNTCLQVITVQDTFKPTFNNPADVTIFREFSPSGTQLLVNYDFNKGNSYLALAPFLYSQIKSKIDTSSVVFMRDTGTVTGNLAFANNNFAGKSLKVENSKTVGHWQFNISGPNLPIFTNFEVYVQALRLSNGSAKTLLMDYSLNGTVWTNFSNTLLTKAQWTQCKASVPTVSYPTKLYIRVRYTDANDSVSKELYIDNFQIRAYKDAEGCAFDDIPNKTGYPDNISHPCDPNPTANYSDSLVLGSCTSKVYRTWTVTDDCGNSKTAINKQIITIRDTTGPVITCPAGNLISRKADTMVCYYTADTSLDAKAFDACTLDSVSITNNYNSKSTLKGEKISFGLHSITWTATDQCGNTSSCKYLLNVFETERPIARCKNDTIILDSITGKFVTHPDSVDNGSSDNCSIKSKTLDRTKFGCDDIPMRQVKFVVTDSSGLTDSCIATLFILDKTAPKVTCKNITISLPTTGVKTITADSVISSSYDNCGIVTKTVKPDTFTCKSPKVTTVVVTVTDASNNKGTCSSTVTLSTGDGDCDGVNDVCDVCPKTDDTVDNNGDGLPDCNVIPPFAQVLSTWKCSQVPQRVYISEIVNGVCTTKCVAYSTFVSTRKSNQYLGICAMCATSLEGNPKKDTLAEEAFDPSKLNKINIADPSIDFHVIPNPNNGSFDIVFENPVEDGMLEIYNMLDQAVWKKVIDSPTERVKLSSIDFNQNASGMYWVIFKNKNTKIIQSMLIIK
ncbi:MAG: T9SS type A sorting domain-containing protein [Saprospiraceae bacterium]